MVAAVDQLLAFCTPVPASLAEDLPPALDLAAGLDKPPLRYFSTAIFGALDLVLGRAFVPPVR